MDIKSYQLEYWLDHEEWRILDGIFLLIKYHEDYPEGAIDRACSTISSQIDYINENYPMRYYRFFNTLSCYFQDEQPLCNYFTQLCNMAVHSPSLINGCHLLFKNEYDEDPSRIYKLYSRTTPLKFIEWALTKKTIVVPRLMLEFYEEQTGEPGKPRIAVVEDIPIKGIE